MRNKIYVCNRIMRPLKAYIERGESNEHVLKAVQILNQLEDDELAFIMVKYVTLATFREDSKVIKQANATKVKDHLQIKDKDFKSLQNKVSNRVYDLYFDEQDKAYQRGQDMKRISFLKNDNKHSHEMIEIMEGLEKRILKDGLSEESYYYQYFNGRLNNYKEQTRKNNEEIQKLKLRLSDK